MVWALLPLRAFLGFTFCFAGLQKLANPGFFQPSNPGSIQAQLAGAVRVSPVHLLISPLTHVAVPLGLLIAFAELAVGLGTLLGLWQRLAAAGGVALSLMLFLVVSFHASPYYTGSDIVFAFAWTPLLLAGAGPVLSADVVIAARARTRAGRGSRRVTATEASRREVVLRGNRDGRGSGRGPGPRRRGGWLGPAGRRHEEQPGHHAPVPDPVGVRPCGDTHRQRF
jgi:thiosulfate dehydrogenase [quinone] large subunit